MIRQGLQYALARGVVLALVPALAAILLADLLLHSDQPLIAILRGRGWVYVFGAALALLAHSRRKYWLETLDRRFFREHYDAQRLLRDVVEEVREAGSFERVAPRVVARIEAALHAEFVALLVRDPREPSYHSIAATPAGQAPPPLVAESKLVSLMRVLGKPLDISSTESGWLSQQIPHGETDFVRQARIELLIPIAMNPELKEALLTLGFKRSEEPYSQEDREILVTIAANLALLLGRPAMSLVPMSDAFEECPQCGTCYDTGSAHCAQEGASLAPVSLPRALAGRYHLNRRLGRGGMGTVYEAVDTALDRRVAVKLVRDDLMGSAVAAERFRQEARAAASFAHPNVVTVYDFGLAASMRAFLVMELLEGTTLRAEFREQARFTASRTLEILRCVCAAIDAAHRRQLIHRDLKPENVFLVRGETGESPKVLDFGLAKFLTTGAEQTLDTGAGVLVGTVRYMSPEQLRGQPVEPAWDLWALSVVAYEMLTGAQPFVGSTALESYSAVLSGRFTPVSKHLPESPGRWQDFFAEAFALDREQRPGTARMLLSRLERALS
jgi:serine/threonine-protein kinase